MIRNHAAMTRLAEMKAGNRRLKFRRAHSKQDNIWGQQYPPGERNLRCNLKMYPTRPEAVLAWRRGARKARDMARRTGMAPVGNDGNFSDIKDSDDDDNDDNDDNNDHDDHQSLDYDTDDDNSWFYKPFSKLKYEELFSKMVSDKELEELEKLLEVRNSHYNQTTEEEEDLEQIDGDEESYDHLIFSQSQRLVSDIIEEAAGNASDKDSSDTPRHKSDIFIPAINQRRFKSSVVRELSKHEKAYADRLLRIKQSSSHTDQDQVVRNLTDRHTFGLFDNVAIESIDTSSNCFELGQITRMRRHAGNRKIEYIEPICKEDDACKEIKLLLKMYNLHQEQNTYKPTTVTKIVNLDDIITHVNMIQCGDMYKLSTMDLYYLESYFPFTDHLVQSHSANDDGRRVQLTVSRSGRIRRDITYRQIEKFAVVFCY